MGAAGRGDWGRGGTAAVSQGGAKNMGAGTAAVNPRRGEGGRAARWRRSQGQAPPLPPAQPTPPAPHFTRDRRRLLTVASVERARRSRDGRCGSGRLGTGRHGGGDPRAGRKPWGPAGRRRPRAGGEAGEGRQGGADPRARLHLPPAQPTPTGATDSAGSPL